MSAIDEILGQLPLDSLAASLGTDPATVEQATRAALPALLGGMSANAQDPRGEESLARAVASHDPGLASGPIDVSAVDTADGEKITRHVFGDNTDQVLAQLGGVGGSKGMVSKLLPILAPIVLSYLAGKVAGTGRSAGAPQAGPLGSILGEVLKGASQGSGGKAGGLETGSILGDVLGGLLGQGRR